MNLESLAAYMVGARLGTAGKTLFVNEMPNECREGILLLQRYGGTPINNYLPGWRDTGFRLAVRSPDYDKGQALAWKAIKALSLVQETQMKQMLVKQMLPLQEPMPYKRSVGGYWEFELEFSCVVIDQR